MVTTREWWRDGLRAWGASALVPTAVLIAVAVLAIGGGVGGVRSLGQLFSGPTVPSPVEAAGNVDVGQQEQQIPVPRIPRRVVSAGGTAAASVRSRPLGSGRSTPTHHRSSSPTLSPHPSPTQPVTTPQPPPVTTPQPTPPPPAPRKTITDRLGDTLNRVVGPIPLVGPTATKAIDAVVTTVDKVLPLPPSAARLLDEG